jgi:hypothetical protein
MNENALVAVPGYHIGEHDHKYNNVNLHDEETEQQLLININWPDNGYSIFDISCFSGANTHGYLHPLLESNCLSVRKKSLITYGGAKEEYKSTGGGAVNLDLYRGLCLNPDTQLFVLAGEGSFHQYHGGVTTMQRDDLDELLNSFQEEYKAVNGEYYEAARREPTLIGAVTSAALPYLKLSIEGSQRRFLRFSNEPKKAWRDDY